MNNDQIHFYHESEEEAGPVIAPWKILVVDDDQSIHQVTALALKDVLFEGRGLEFIHCFSAQEAIQTMGTEDDIALIFLDVVMETDTAGLEVAQYIREKLHNLKVRIILRTGQPGYAPEARVILDYDINDYKTKTELTSAKLHTTVISALRSYQEIDKSESLRIALGKMLDSAKTLLTTNNHDELLKSLTQHTLAILPLCQKFEPPPLVTALLEINLDTFELSQKQASAETLSEVQADRFVQLAKKMQQDVKSIVEDSFALLHITASGKNTYVFLALEYCNPIDTEEHRLLLNLAYDIEIACNNVCLRESLTLSNEQLEKQVQQRTLQLNVARIRAEQANQEKSRFLSNMSHEIRTPMNAILGFTQILKRSYEYPKEQQLMLDKIDHSGQHLLEIVNDVLDISKIEAGAMTLNKVDFDLVLLIDDISNIYNFRCEQKNLDWSLDHDLGKSLFVHGDQGKIRQVLNNLLGNSLKFTDTGSITLNITSSKNQYTFTVKDTGPGIGINEKENLFANFTQGKAGIKKGGTGLGLAISSKQISLMGGALDIDSNIGQGSDFHFSIAIEPCAPGTLINKENKIEQIYLNTHKPFKALCVDDVASNREILGNILMSAGINVTYACDGQEAINLLNKEVYDVVFMDLMMPIMCGDEAVKIIRGELNMKQLSCIAVSAFSLSHEIQHYLSIGFDSFIAKPFRVSDIFKNLLNFFPDEFKQTEFKQGKSFKHKEIKMTDFSMPADYLDGLKSAAVINRSSQVKKILSEISINRPKDQLYIDYLSNFIDDFNMDGLISALEDIKYEQ